MTDEELYDKYKYELRAELVNPRTQKRNSKGKDVPDGFHPWPMKLILRNCSVTVTRTMNLYDTRNDLMRKVEAREK